MDQAANAHAEHALQVKRTKEILSANAYAPFNVEEVLDGIDFRSSITRCHYFDPYGHATA